VLRSATLGILITVFGACAEEGPLPIPDTCNGDVALCSRGYDQVSYVTTHNAMSNAEEEWVNPNQYWSVTTQLQDGVRALMLDIHPFEDDIYLCHGICQLGSKPLVEGLGEIEDFLAHNRGEVITLILESYVTAADVAAAMETSGLIDYAFAPGAGPWPTLRQLIDADTRLIVLTDSDGGAYPWYVDVWEQAWETHFSARETTDFSCDPNRGNPDNPLFIFNHFLTRTIPVPDEAETVNSNPFLIDRALQCVNESGALPNFVTVDFYSVGDVFAAVDQLNALP
jgi:hypothetical protein